MKIDGLLMKRIALNMLSQLSELQANAGCNDFDLQVLVPDLDQRLELMKLFNTLNGSPEDFEEDMKYGQKYKIVSDFVLTSLVEKWLETMEVKDFELPVDYNRKANLGHNGN